MANQSCKAIQVDDLIINKYGIMVITNEADMLIPWASVARLTMTDADTMVETTTGPYVYHINSFPVTRKNIREFIGGDTP